MKISPKSVLAAMGLVAAVTLASCTPGERGALIGGALGAGTGALIGDETGALVGGAIGAVAGSEISKNRAARNHYYYDRGYHGHHGHHGHYSAPPRYYRGSPYRGGYYRHHYPYRGRGY
ncbi:MAG: hypothetical protein GXX91_09895 [Verrucomicrobiaceae bacterium]|nr:hypothetical protein [Verrucomicrobiaceae bacterium]